MARWQYSSDGTQSLGVSLWCQGPLCCSSPESLSPQFPKGRGSWPRSPSTSASSRQRIPTSGAAGEVSGPLTEAQRTLVMSRSAAVWATLAVAERHDLINRARRSA
eukprot:7637287-Lingulodinium_polyedra.AAC.1